MAFNENLIGVCLCTNIKAIRMDVMFGSNGGRGSSPGRRANTHSHGMPGEVNRATDLNECRRPVGDSSGTKLVTS